MFGVCLADEKVRENKGIIVSGFGFQYVFWAQKLWENLNCVLVVVKLVEKLLRFSLLWTREFRNCE